MEPRKITIANTRDQRKSVIMSAATTLGELKRDLDNACIDYSDMDFIEALTKTQLKDDSSVLPHDVPHGHTVTNELVFLLTLANRKIKSGSRADVYDRINNSEDSDELKTAIQNHFGKNYTIVTTANLEEFIGEWDDECANENDKNLSDFSEDMKANAPLPQYDDRIAVLEKKVDCIIEAMMNMIDVLGNAGVDVDEIYHALTDNIKIKDDTVYSAGMSSDDIDRLINSLG